MHLFSEAKIVYCQDWRKAQRKATNSFTLPELIPLED